MFLGCDFFLYVFFLCVYERVSSHSKGCRWLIIYIWWLIVFFVVVVVVQFYFLRAALGDFHYVEHHYAIDYFTCGFFSSFSSGLLSSFISRSGRAALRHLLSVPSSFLPSLSSGARALSVSILGSVMCFCHQSHTYITRHPPPLPSPLVNHRGEGALRAPPRPPSVHTSLEPGRAALRCSPFSLIIASPPVSPACQPVCLPCSPLSFVYTIFLPIIFIAFTVPNLFSRVICLPCSYLQTM